MVYKIVAISGSLAKNSSNSGLIRACILVNNPDVQIEIVDISGFPLFNMDPIIQNGYPAVVQSVREKVAQADAVIFASPQHNSKISAALKNAYDWLSFTHDLSQAPPIKQKASGLIVSSLSGGIKAQEHFTRVCQYCKVKLFNKALLISKKQGDFDQNGNIVNPQIMYLVQQFLKSFVFFLKQVKK